MSGADCPTLLHGPINCDVIMSAMASQITSLTIVYSTIYSGVDQRKHQSSASLAFVRRIHRWPVNSPHKWPVTQKMFPFDDVIMLRTWNFDDTTLAYENLQMWKQETCRSIKLRELSACGRFVSHTKATEHKCRMTAHGPSSTSQLRRPRMLRCPCLPPRSLHVLGAFGSLSKSHISFKVT